MSVLTIGMIVKNEEKHLPVFLDKLEELRRQVDCTVVITDTGSSDNTPEIARSRADRYYEYAWNDDFSAARNTTLQNLDSEWYIYLDADELCEDPAPLIEFFKSGEYKKYRAATIIIHNILSSTANDEFRAARAYAVTPDIQFAGIIHEHITIRTDSIANINVVFRHDGYAPDVIRSKELRNVPLLRKEIATTPFAIHKVNSYFQLGEALFRLSPEEAMESWNIGLELSFDEKIPPIWKYCFLARMEMFHYFRDDFAKVCDVHEKYAEIRKNDDAYSRVIYLDLEDACYSGIAYNKMGDPEKAVKLLEQFTEYFKLYHTDNAAAFAADNMIYPAVNVSDEAYTVVSNEYVDACMSTGRYDAALRRLLEAKKNVDKMLICMDNLSDFSALPGLVSIKNALSDVKQYLPKAVHPYELLLAADGAFKTSEKYHSDFAIIAEYIKSGGSGKNLPLHNELVLIEYIMSMPVESGLDDLRSITDDYINRVYLIHDPIHYSPMVSGALNRLKNA
jgi:glycosyltransferase involved in cell wall biosynthesis